MGVIYRHIQKKPFETMKIISALAPFALAAPPMGGVGVCFMGSIYKCVPVMESPICTEGDPAFNPVVCAVKANRCFLESMSGIPDCVEQINENDEYYNPIACAIKLNACLVNGFDDVFSCMNGEPAKVEEKDIDAIGITECFVKWITQCEESTHTRFCDEQNPNYNAVACAIQINRCLLGGMDEVWECMP